MLSQTTRDLLGGDLPLRDLGEHRLKDLVRAERLFQLGEGEFPPLRTLDATNLPLAATSLLGRERELAELVGLLSNGSRLVTITGQGGTGKTRLALQAAAELVGRMRDGVFWVPLAGLSDPELVVPEIAQTIGARDDLDGFLRGKELLLLLDNLEHDNLRAAFEWLSANDVDSALKLAGALGWFWQARARAVEGLERLGVALAGSSAGGAVRARALTAYAALAGWQGDIPTARARMEEALALWLELGDVAEEASALDHLGWVLVYMAGDDHGALAAFERSLELRRRIGDPLGETRALVGVAQVLVALGEVDRAEELSREVLERAQRDRDLRSEHFAYHFLADCALIRGDCAEAEGRYRQSLRSALPLGDVMEASIEIQGVAMSAGGLGDARRAVRLAGAVDALWESLGVAVSVRFWDELLERYVGAAAAELGGEADLVRAQGRQLSFEGAVDEALAV